MKIKVKQKSDFHFIGSGAEYKGELPIDAASHVGGKGRGFRPPELLFYSVAACMGIHSYEVLHKAGKHVDGLEVDTDGTRRESKPIIFTSMLLKFKITGKDLTDGDIRGAITEALVKTCSIAVMVNMTCPITCEYECGSLKGTVTAPPFKA